MAGRGITFQDVADAAVKLQGLNKNTTVDNVRSELGTGSKSTIARHLKTWKEDHNISNITAGLPKELLSITQGLWEKLQHDAQQRINQHEKEAQEHQHMLQEQIEQLQYQVQEDTKSIEQLTIKLKQQIQLNDELQRITLGQQIEQAKLKEKNIALEKQILQEEHENQRLHQLLKQTQNNLEHYQETTQKQHDEQVVLLEKQNLDFQLQKSELQNEILIKEKYIQELSVKFNQINFESSHIKQQYIELQKQYCEQAEKYDKTSHELIISHEQVKQYLQQIQIMKLDLESASQIRINLEKQLTAFELQVNQLENNLFASNNKIVILQEEIRSHEEENASCDVT